MKKLLTIILFLITMPSFAQWVLVNQLWRNTGTGQLTANQAPAGVNTLTPTFTPTISPTPLPILMSGATNNTFVGNQTGLNIIDGTQDTCMGDSSGISINGGSFDTYYGYRAGWWTTSGSNNTAIGSLTLGGILNGYNNTAVGSLAGAGAGTDHDNVYIGYTAGGNTTGATQNVIIGSNAGTAAALGGSNVMVGYATGNVAGGSGNVFIGNGVGGIISGNNKLAIHNSNSATPLIGGDFSGGSVTINGWLIIGTAAANKSLTVTGNMQSASYSVGSTPTPGYELTPSAIPYGAPMTFNNGILTGIAPTPTPNIMAFSASIANPMTPTYFACTPCATTSKFTGNAMGAVPTATPPTVSFQPVAGGVSITLGGTAALTIGVMEAP